jgi:SAM-dependent methyltransferase
MSPDSIPVSQAGSTAEDYSHSYYNEAHLGGYGDYNWDNPDWRNFFVLVADRIIGLTQATTVFDVGCAKGLLVHALALRGVDARGRDISTYAIESAHEDVRPRLEIGSATEPIERRYDLVTCIEVLEHMSPTDAQAAIDRMCEASDRILFSSTPSDFAEPTHVNVHPTSHWAAWMAERGFYRRTDVDLTFLTQWAVLFERRDDESVRDVVQGYETYLAPIWAELLDKREALLEAHREISSLTDGPRKVDATDRSIQERHAALVARDNVIGLEAQVSRLREDLRTTRAKLRRLRSRLEARDEELEAMRLSRSWKVGRALTAPVRKLRP